MILRFSCHIIAIIGLAWEFTQSNFSTFVVPNTAFGIFGAFVPLFYEPGPHGLLSAKEILLQLPVVLGFNWYNVLVFDLGNQRSAESLQEDILNKPWRPLPTGKVTPDQARVALLVLIPVSMWINYHLGVWEQGVLIPILSYLYNDLRGGDELLRDPIISVAYAVANTASLKIAVRGQDITSNAHIWITMISGVILTTMQVQDLKDQAGDRSRGRLTVALIMGDLFSRTFVAVFVAFWSLGCTLFWNLGIAALALPGITGAIVICRLIRKRSPMEDSKTWKWWCLWTVTLYSLPICAVSWK